MSLQQILSQYSQDIQAREQHNDENENDIRDRKAQTLEEQFQNHLDHFTSGAVDLGSASSAFHLGRKVYKAYRDGKAKIEQKKAELQKAQEDAGKGDDAPTGEEGEASKPNPVGDSDPVRNAGGGDAVAEQQGTADSLDNRISDVQERFRNLKAKVDAQNERLDAPDERPRPSRNVRTAVREDTPSGDITAPKPEDAKPQQADVSENADSSQRAPAQEEATEPNAQIQATGDAPEPMPGMEGRAGTVLRSGGSEPTPNQGGNPRVQETNLDEVAGRTTTGTGETAGGEVPLPSENPGTLSNIGADSESGVSGIVDKAGNMAKNVASKATNALKSTLPESGMDALDTGLLTSDAILDGIPVVGEIASVVTGLIGLFEGLGHKADPDDKKAQPQTGAPAQGSTAIDPEALERSQAGSTVQTIV